METAKNSRNMWELVLLNYINVWLLPHVQLDGNKYSGTRLQRHRFIRHLVYSVRYSVVPINSSLLTTPLHYSVRTTPVYNDPGPLMTL
jgi:hypothetical protein